MASQSQHTEPNRPHTKDELMHPGRHHHSQSSDMTCPDPSMHKNSKLQEQASTAALYVTSPGKKAGNSNQGALDANILDANNKLSSRSAAMSLKHAKAEDLPGFPVVGINTANSANAAANLANTNHKSFEHWKPDASSNAGKAAMLAKDYKMAPLWKPEMSAAGSKAALLAHKDGGKLNLWYPEASAEGNSAAGIAMRNKTLSPKIDYGYTDDGRKKALMAAAGAVGRSRSGSTPTPAHPAYPDSANSAYNALNAATAVHRASSKATLTTSSPGPRYSTAMEAARVGHIGNNVSREMWTERPPVQLEVDEKKHNDALRASAVSMAKQMYALQAKQADESPVASDGMGGSAARHVHGRNMSASSTPDLKQQAMQYIHLQEAAHKLAAERLAKLDPDASTRYRAYYGYEADTPRSRLSMRGRGRRRAGSEGQKSADSSDEDELQSRKIRSQMSQFNKDVAAIDAKKQKSDRANLMAAAERKVHAQMHNMDEKVFAETGKVSPAMMEEWETKARAKAAADSTARMENHGKLAIGGGKYMDKAEIEAIAAARLKPTLDQINETAEKKRARDEEIRLADEERKRNEVRGKQNDKFSKEEAKRIKEEEKLVAKQEKLEQKNAARMEKDAEKARRAEEKRLEKENKRKSRDVKKDDKEAIEALAVTEPVAAVSDGTSKSDEAPQTPVMAQEPSLERQETPISIRSPGAEAGTLHPNLERHVSKIGESDSDSLSSDDELEPSGANDVVAAVLVDNPNVHITSDEPAAVESAEETLTSTQPYVVEKAAVPATSFHSVGATTARDASKITKSSKPETAVKSDVSTPSRESAKVTKTPKTDNESKGRISGLFSKLAHRRTKSQAEAKETPKAASGLPTKTSATINPAADSTGLSPDEATVATAGVAEPGAASPSSFRRHKDDLQSISSLSSDEGNELDAARGREKRRSRFDDSDGDEFEEARDHFDEGLAPPPSFGGQAKSSSPVRETKFVEEL